MLPLDPLVVNISSVKELTSKDGTKMLVFLYDFGNYKFSDIDQLTLAMSRILSVIGFCSEVLERLPSNLDISNGTMHTIDSHSNKIYLASQDYKMFSKCQCQPKCNFQNYRLTS